MPEYTYITPQMTRKQLDSTSVALRKYDISLNFDTVVYDNKMIKKVEGALDTNNEYFPLTSDNFKGMTIISRGDSIAVIMGILPKK